MLISTLDRDPEAGYLGAELHERTLLPGDGARVGEIRFRDWLAQPVTDYHRRSLQRSFKKVGPQLDPVSDGMNQPGHAKPPR